MSGAEESRVFELLEHASRQNLCDKDMPWPQNHAELARWVMAMDLRITVAKQATSS